MADSATSNRRDFLLGAGLGAAAAMAPAVARTTPEAADKAAPGRPGGYRASAHVLKYYKSTEA